MSLSVEGQNCPVCHAYLFDDDDIVFCPICGVPHHRDCYKAVGHCALEGTHGTEEQYDIKRAREQQAAEEEAARATEASEKHAAAPHCRVCGRPIDEETPFCPHCRAPRDFAQFDPFGGIGKDSVVEGITAGEIARFTQINTPRYVKKFFFLGKERRTSWNWAAFLFPSAWACYRKNYKSGILLGILLLAGSLLSIPLRVALDRFVLTEGTYAEMVKIFMDNIDTIGLLPIALSLAGFMLNLGVRVFSGAFADWFYRGRVLESIREIKKAETDPDTLFRKLGGVSPIWFLAVYMLQTYLPSIISLFL